MHAERIAVLSILWDKNHISILLVSQDYTPLKLNRAHPYNILLFL